jgi:hypothetical protein
MGRVVGPPGPPGLGAGVAASTVVSLIVTQAPKATLTEFEGSFCGTPAKKLPSSLLASALLTFASTLEGEGSLANRIEQEAGVILQRAFGLTSSSAAKAGS